MRAARAFAERLADDGVLDRVTRITCSLYGSLGATGLGHGTPDAVVAGLAGLRPDDCDPDDVRGAWSRLGEAGGEVRVAGSHPITMTQGDLSLEPRTRLPGHPNALTLQAWGEGEALPLAEETYYSVGGGFIRREGDAPEAVGGTAASAALRQRRPAARALRGARRLVLRRRPVQRGRRARRGRHRRRARRDLGGDGRVRRPRARERGHPARRARRQAPRARGAPPARGVRPRRAPAATRRPSGCTPSPSR